MTHENTIWKTSKPVPEDTVDEAPFWDGARRHELVLQRARDHNLYIHPPMIGAPPWCAGAELEWVSLGSDILGTVYSFTVVHRAFSKSFAEDVPYVVAMCDIPEAPGARVLANVVGIPPEEVHVGLRVRMFWEDRADGSSVPQWGPS